MFLIFLIALVNSTGVMRLDYIPALSPDDGIFLQNKECIAMCILFVILVILDYCLLHSLNVFKSNN